MVAKNKNTNLIFEMQQKSIFDIFLRGHRNSESLLNKIAIKRELPIDDIFQLCYGGT